MFSDLIQMTAVELRAPLVGLEAELGLARSSGVADLEAYMTDLEVEIQATRRLYVTAAVIEIATLRAELSATHDG